MPATAAFESEAEPEPEVAPEIATFRLAEKPPQKPPRSQPEPVVFEKPPQKPPPSEIDWLPELRHVRWEWKPKAGCVEAWSIPTAGKTTREHCTYLARIGKKLSAAWLAMNETDRRAAIEAWLAEAKRKKGIE